MTSNSIGLRAEVHLAAPVATSLALRKVSAILGMQRASGMRVVSTRDSEGAIYPN